MDDKHDWFDMAIAAGIATAFVLACVGLFAFLKWLGLK